MEDQADTGGGAAAARLSPGAHPVVLTAVLWLAGSAVVVLFPAASLARAVASQALWVLLAGVSGVSALRRARREPAAAAGWRLLGLSLLAMGLAAAATIVPDVTAGTVHPFPRLGDWLQLPAFVLMAFALLAWPLGSPSPSIRLRTFLDALLFAVAVFATIWGTVLWSVRTSGVPAETWAVIVSQFGIMTVLFAIIAYLGLGDTARLRGPLGWMAATLGTATLGSLGILAAGARGTYYVGHVSDLAAGAAMVVFVLATTSPRPVTGAARRSAPLLDPLLFGGWLTYGSIAVAFVIGFWAMIVQRRGDLVILVLGFGIILLLVLRQVLAVRDVRELTNGLEAKVAERTRALEESQAAILRTARLEALGRLAGGVAHDMNNLLTGILGYAELIEQASPPGDARRGDAEEIRKSVERGARLTRQLLAFARKQPGHAQVLDPLDLVTDMRPLLARLLGPAIALEVCRDRGSGRVRIDPGQFEQVIVNMAVNARDAMPSAGSLTIAIADAEVDAAEAGRLPGARAGAFVRTRVQDNGAGMSAAVLARIFEPFFTTKGEGKGTGLGLATCYGIVNQAGGFVTVESAPGRGTRFDVYLPLTTDAEEWTPSREGIAAPSRGTETVLLAEDEPAVREVMAATLQAQGYTVLVTADGAEAVAVAERHQGPIAVFLTDMMMPRLSGLEAAAILAVRRPGLRVLVVSGFMPEAPRGTADGMKVAYVTKPVSPLELVRQVRALLDEPDGDAAVTPPPGRPAAP
jgi:signal transduction histidine kinase/ActR/RegA family two-component response regulator